MPPHCHIEPAYDRRVDGLRNALADVVGHRFVVTDADVLTTRSTDQTGRYAGRACALVRPADTAEIAALLNVCRSRGVPVTVQGGRTGLVAGTVPEHDDVLLSTERLAAIGDVDLAAGRITVGAGVTLAQVHSAAAAAGLKFGVDIASRDTATIGGMVSTNAGGLHTVRYGNMAEQVLGLEVVLPDGTTVRRSPKVLSDNSGYNLPALWVGSEGTLGVVTSVDLKLRKIPTYRVTSLIGFDALQDVVEAGRVLRALDGVDALELLDGRGLELAARHLNAAVPTGRPWYLLAEVSAAHDPLEDLAELLERIGPPQTPAVAVDAPGSTRLWAARECFAEVVGLFGPPLKFDAALPLDSLATFTEDATAVIASRAPEAIPILFGHVAEGNIHLNVLNCPNADIVYRSVLELVRDHGGNVSSEHGVGSLKRNYLDLALSAQDIATMWAIKRALDPSDYLNRAVMFPDALRH
ncbi:FAD-binding oxidoreductase [Rhodococcus sp. ARP2]|uniref:FAD-binding oxidoreductase n=1 Tax=Rhodococcus sp. ARP2 TaxID=1661385 RepID=UPI00064BD8B3|nr:FAD-binding oxidoreductase [Rhodococcus sp. ARP2]